jgi:hypothetical protein
MFRLTTLTLIAAAACAQNPADLFNRAPADIDQALRARISEFYQYHVTGEYRKAEALVAEDTKDFFYDHNKPRYLSFQIGNIEYSGGYTRAKALVVVKMSVMLPGFNGKVMDIPSASYWKLIDGKWYWYVDESMRNASPFGQMKPGPNTATAGDAPALPAIPGSTEQLHAMVRPDKSDLTLKPGASEQVSISNSMPGPVDLEVTGKPAGVEVSFDRAQVKTGEKAVMTVHAAQDAKDGTVAVRVQQTGQLLKFPVSVK